VLPRHAEVLSSVGAALSLVRAEVTRSALGDLSPAGLALEAERACVELGAAPATVTVETAFEPREGVIRAVATGAVALEAGVAGREPPAEPVRLQAAADALSLDRELLSLLARTEYYSVYSENGSGRVAVVDPLGAVPVAEDARRVFAADGEEFLARLAREVEEGSRNLGVATMLPRVVVVCGSRILDLSDARRAEDVLDAAREAVAAYASPAVALLAR
jgi:hypothetical protein